jgi:CRP-like cAMP-binding protein
MAVDVALLDGIPAFAGTTPEARRRVASLADRVDASAGSILFHEGDPATEVYFLVSGRVSLGMRMGDREMLVLTLRAGEMTGWSGLLPHGRVATARVVDDAVLLRFEGQALLDACEADHELGYRVMKDLFGDLARRLHDTRLQLVDMFGPSRKG